MRIPFSLRWKILAWFFVNLAVVGVVVLLFLRAQFRVGINSLLAGSTGDRLEAIALPLIADLRRAPKDGPGGALERAVNSWRSRGVRAALFRDDGTYLAGDVHELPPEILQILAKNVRPKSETPPTPVAGTPPGNPSRTPPRRRPAMIVSPLPKFMIVTGSPRLYWAGVHLGKVERPAPRELTPPVTLLLFSDSLRGGGLFFDYLPWLGLGGALVLISILLWVPFVHGLTRALTRLTRSAEAIAEGRFDPAPKTAGHDELGRLNRAHFHMAAQIESFVAGQKRFLGDTAHELLSPLARLEVALSILEHRAPTDDRAYTECALEEVRHMSELVKELLTFAKADMGASNLALRPVSLAELASRVAARETKDASVIAVDVPSTLRALAEPDLLSRALGNVIRNALRYANPISIGSGGHSFRPMLGPDGRPAGPITISACERAGQVVLTVADCGPGVDPEVLPRLLDPFFRPDTARARETGGTGLGLAIVKSCVEACGGRVAVSNREPHGLQLEFFLQRAA
jgi:two-component system sensor histidine kinase CpxA